MVPDPPRNGLGLREAAEAVREGGVEGLQAGAGESSVLGVPACSWAGRGGSVSFQRRRGGREERCWLSGGERGLAYRCG